MEAPEGSLTMPEMDPVPASGCAHTAVDTKPIQIAAHTRYVRQIKLPLYPAGAIGSKSVWVTALHLPRDSRVFRWARKPRRISSMSQ